MYALDAYTGEELWNVVVGDVDKGETFSAAPLAWNGLVFIGNAGGDNFGVTGRMMALDADSGGIVWSTELVADRGAESPRGRRAGAEAQRGIVPTILAS